MPFQHLPMYEVMYISAGLLALVVLCWVINLLLVAKAGAPNIWLTRLMYLCAVAALILHGVRSFLVYEEKTMFFATVVAFACIIISWVRTELARHAPEA